MRKGRMTVGTGLAVVGIGFSAISAGATGGGGPVAESILGSGSDTTQTMMAYLDYGYIYDSGYGDGTFGGCQQLATPAAQWLDFSCAGPQGTGGDVNRTVTDGVTSAGSTKITSATAHFVSTYDQGRGIDDTGGLNNIPAGDYIASVTNATTAVLAKAATGTGSADKFSINTIVTDNYRHDQVHGAFFLGSSSGVSQLCLAGGVGPYGEPVAHIDYARSSRAPKASDCHGLDFVAYALDGISWEAWNIAGSGINNGGAGMNNASAPCLGHTICLTQAQLKAIYITCSITNWDQVGGANVPIQLFTPQPGSGTRATFDTFLGGSSTSCMTPAQVITNQIPENDNEGIPTALHTGAIFPFSYGVYSVSVGLNPMGTVLGEIDGVTVNRTTIANGTFPYDRSLYNVYNPATAQAGVGAYVGPEGWICGTQNQHSFASNGANFHFVVASKITAAGFVPIPLGPIGGGDPNSDYCRLTVS